MKNSFMSLFFVFLLFSCESTEINESNKTLELASRPPSGFEPIDPIDVNESGAVFLQTTSLENVNSDCNEIFCGGGGTPLTGTPNYFGMSNINFNKNSTFYSSAFFPGNGFSFSNELKRIIEVIYPPYYMFPVAPGQHFVVDGYFSFTYFEQNIPYILSPSQANALRDKILLAIQQQLGNQTNNLYINQTYVSNDYMLCATEWGLITVSFQYGHWQQ